MKNRIRNFIEQLKSKKPALSKEAGHEAAAPVYNLTVLRGLAVFAVFCHHLEHVSRMKIWYFGTHGGWFGVQLFYMLSGYLIIKSAQRYSPAQYWTHRVLRIFPAYLFVYVVLGFLTHHLSAQQILQWPAGFVLNLTLLQHLFPKALILFNVNNVSWTLTIEGLWYVTAFFIWRPFAARPAATALCLILVSALWSFGATSGILSGVYAQSLKELAPDNPQPLFYLFVQNAFPAQVGYFAMGALIRFKEKEARSIHTVFLAAAFLLFGLFPQWMFTHISSPCILSGVGVAGLFVLCLKAPRLKIPGLYFLGEISYSVYLIHFMVILYMFQAKGLGVFWGSAASIGCTVAISFLMFRFIEAPAMAAARRRSFSLGKKRARPA